VFKVAVKQIDALHLHTAHSE